MTKPIFLDTETVGLHGMPVLLQYAVGDGEIVLYELWDKKISETLFLIEQICNNPNGIIGFNLAFDWFHLSKIYTTFKLAHARLGDIYPDEYIDEIAVLEKEARDGPCLKPVKCLDLMLHSRKGPYQSLMNRDDIRIKRVPTALAFSLAKMFSELVPLDDIYFARSKERGLEKWKVYDVKNSNGVNDPDFKDIVCKFSPSGALKALAVHALKVPIDDVLKFNDIECNIRPDELGWAPFALAKGQPGNWNNAWPAVISHHITHWGYNELARKYAGNDIVYTRGLYHYFKQPAMSDEDSILACQVASVRWRGFAVDIDGIKELRDEAVITAAKYPKDGGACRRYLEQVMNAEERVTILESTKKIILEEICDEWKNDDGSVHEAAIRATNILAARKAKKEVEIYDKLITAGRFHCSFKVIGTKSYRMSGTDGLNPQGINHSKKVRSKFTFAWPDLILCGGDFSSFEVSLAAAVYKDPLLDEDLRLGKKMAGLFGMMFFPELSYDDIVDTDGDDEEDLYDLSKRGMYQFFYGGTPEGMAKKLGFDPNNAKNAIDALMQRYKGIGREREYIGNLFTALRQPGGIGSQVTWHDPADYIESPLGDKRYFTLENRICKALYGLAQKPPTQWKDLKFKVVRRDRQQTPGGATQSALYAAAFNIVSSTLRAALNHRIQCFGGRITKSLQCIVWEFQPCGIQKWHVMPFNCHDECDALCLPELCESIKNAALAKVESYRSIVPMIGMKWDIGLKSWKSKEPKLKVKKEEPNSER